MEQELNQDEATQEQPEVASQETTEATPQVTSAEEKATSERTYSEAEWRKMQSMKDTADAKSQKYERELQEFRRKDYERELADRRKELEMYEGDSDKQEDVRRKHQLQDEIKDLEGKNEELKGAVLNKYDQAKALVKEHNLNPDDIFKLMDETTTETEMKLMAENLGLKATEQEKSKAPPKEKESSFKPDSATSDAGVDSDEAFLKRWNAGEELATKENLARAQKIVNK